MPDMDWLISFILILGSLSGFTRLPPTEQAAPLEQVGVRTITYQDTARNRPILVELWYPTQKTGPVDAPEDMWVHPLEVRDAPLSALTEKYPLILMSHGHGGDRRERSWLAESLVKSGYIVASVDHHGNSHSTYNVETSLRFWERARDISNTLTFLQGDSTLKDRIDSQRIGFVGYSLGGLTGLSLGGARAQNAKEVIKQQQARYKEIDLERLDQIDFSESQLSFADPRIKAFVLLTPATFVFPSESLQEIKAPVALVVSEDDEVLPHREHGQRLITSLQPEKVKLFHKTSHYAFLNRVSPAAKAHIPPSLSSDAIEASRPQLHQEVSQFTLDFFSDKLK